MKNPVLKTILWTWLLSFPLAAIVACFYRFPIPFSDYESGLTAAPKALGAVLFYTITGGFIIVPLLGWMAFIIGNKVAYKDNNEKEKWKFIFSFIFASAAVLLMSILDKIIGSW